MRISWQIGIHEGNLKFSHKIIGKKLRERWKEGKGKAKEKYYKGINIKEPKFKKHTVFLSPKEQSEIH